MPEPDDEATRPTVPDQPVATVALPLSPALAGQLAQSLQDYATACVAVKKALDLVSQDDGKAYRDARELKHAHYGFVLNVMDRALAYIGVHAR